MLKQKFALDFSSKSFHYFLQAIGGIVVARFAGPEILGIIAYGMAFAGVFGFINGLFGPAHMKIVAEAGNEGDCNSTFVTIKLLSTVFFVLCVVLFYLVQRFVFNVAFESREKEIIIFIALGVVLFQNLEKISERIFIARMQQARANLPTVIHSILYNFGRAALAVLGFGAIALTSVQIVVYVLLIPIVFYLLRDIPFGKFDKKLAKRYLLLSIPIFIIVFSNSLSLNVGRLILEGFSDTTSLGMFVAGNNIASIFGLIAATAGTMFFPLFARAVANHEFESIVRRIKMYERFIFNWIFPWILFLSIFAEIILTSVLGERYLPAAGVFRILVFASFLKIVAIPFANLLFSFDKFNISAMIAVSNLLIQIGLVYLLAHPDFFNLGIIGLAIAIITSEVFIFCIRYYYAKQLVNLNSLKENLSYFLLGGISYGLFFLMKYYYFSSYISNIFLMISFMIFIPSLFYLSGLLTKSDINELKVLVSAKLMKQYIKRELTINDKPKH
ncbi:oligosaccharide flippase family protein [Desulfotignum balticum]|uniref:oligosaccharide flippase family protein n=1 Tax=Desulfotignum balticum TaxID=115781 RepID=UPI000415D1A6|nr:oligosaccharide flippase family protein [Desulfotignum balticum]